jgi:hypothetical protein
LLFKADLEVNTSFLFAEDEGNVGSPIAAQLYVTSDSHSNTAPVIISRIRGTFKHERFAFELTHDDSVEQSTLEKGIVLQQLGSVTTSTSEDGKLVFSAKSNLNLKHGQKSIWDLEFDIKDSGELVLESLVFEISNSDFELHYTTTPGSFASPYTWHIQESADEVVKKNVYRNTPWITDVKPKPPKLEVTVTELSRALYTDEPVRVTFNIDNGEDEEVSSATLDVRLLGRTTSPEISWIGSNSKETNTSRTLTLASSAPGESVSHVAGFTSPAKPTTLILEARLHYYLPSDPDIPLSKTFSTELLVQSPFEANYEFTNRVHPSPWPSFFEVGSPIPGLLQRWAVVASVASFAEEPLILETVSLEVERTTPGLSCKLVRGSLEENSEILPKTMRSHEFSLDTIRPTSAKHHDRTQSITGNLKIKWRHRDSKFESKTSIVSIIPVSPFILPPLEPRVVASAKHMPLNEKTPLTLISLSLENPTLHPLTFDITTPSSETCAFSGPKQLAVTILPYSRTKVEYRVLALVEKGAWVDMLIKVTDRYFQREVDVLPGEALREGEKGSVKWLVE